MGISNIDRAKSEGTDWITRAGRALREAAVGDGRRHSDAVHVVQPANGPARVGDQPQSERSTHGGAHSNLALARNGSAAQELPVPQPRT